MAKDTKGEKRKENGILRHIGLFALVAAVVLGVVSAAAWRDGTGFDTLLRRFSYGKTGEEKGKFTFEASGDNRFALVGDGLAVLSGTEFQVFDRDGEQAYAVKVNMKSPALVSGGGKVVAYDIGGRELYMADEAGELLHLTADEAEPYISVSLNEKGWMAVTSEKKGYKGGVSVYNGKQEGPVFAFRSSSRFLAGGWVTEDCRYLAAAALGQSESVFVSNIGLYDLDEEAKEPKASCALRDGLVLDLRQKESVLAALTDTALAIVSRSGELMGEYRFDGQYLREYSLGGEGFSALLLNRYRAGSVGRLVTIGDDGAELASLEVREEILSVSAAGRYLAVLYADKLVVYDEELEPYGTLSGTGSARTALAREDGSVVLAGADSAWTYLP